MYFLGAALVLIVIYNLFFSSLKSYEPLTSGTHSPAAILCEWCKVGLLTTEDVMQTPAKDTNSNTPQTNIQAARFFTTQQQVLRMEWQGSLGTNPNLDRFSISDLPRIDQWWLAGRSTNSQSH